MAALLFLAQTLRIAIPYLFAAAGGVASERAGLIGLGLEGYMLGGAFAAALGSYYGHSAWLGVLAGIAGGAALALVYGVSAIRFRADQVVMCIAVNLLVVGATRFFLRLAFGSSSNSPRVVCMRNARNGCACQIEMNSSSLMSCRPQENPSPEGRG